MALKQTNKLPKKGLPTTRVLYTWNRNQIFGVQVLKLQSK